MTKHGGLSGHPAVVPYIASWSQECVAVPGELIVRPDGGGIGYRDEVPGDRDAWGVLWKRELSAPGRGRPEFGIVHGARQRRVMCTLLCQVCSGPADRNELGVLWLMPDHRGDWPNWPEGMGEPAPPLCLPCADASRRLCPALRRGFAAVRVKNPALAGVRGVVYAPRLDWPRVRSIDDGIIGFHDPRLPWTLAHQLARQLNGCTLIDLDQELAERAAQPDPTGGSGDGTR